MDRERESKLPDICGTREECKQCALVVDDVEVNRIVACSILESLGLDVIQARNGGEAVQQVSDQPFDLVLMDLHMPDMGGQEATRRIKEARPDQVVYAWSDDAVLQEIPTDNDTGFHGHLGKPLVRDALEDVIKTLKTD